MNRKIRIAPPHIYLDEHDISAFVSDYKVIDKERVTVELYGDVILPVKTKRESSRKAKNGNR